MDNNFNDNGFLPPETESSIGANAPFINKDIPGSIKFIGIDSAKKQIDGWNLKMDVEGLFATYLLFYNIAKAEPWDKVVFIKKLKEFKSCGNEAQGMLNLVGHDAREDLAIALATNDALTNKPPMSKFSFKYTLMLKYENLKIRTMVGFYVKLALRKALDTRIDKVLSFLESVKNSGKYTIL